MNDLDIWMKAMKKIDLMEAVSPIVNGHLLLEDTQVEFYNKIQRLLNLRGMENAHGWLYNLDPEQLSENECDKINKLYCLAQDKGLIEPNPVEEPEIEEPVKEEPKLQIMPQTMPIKPIVPQSAYTVVYSATRDGDIKTGEAYSNAINTRSAKADILNKLEKAGYTNVSILAIECGDPDCSNIKTYNYPETIPDYSNDAEIYDDDKNDIEEADDREPLGHALDHVGLKASSANLRRNNAVASSMISDDDKVEEDDILDNRNHNAHINEEDDKDSESEEKSEDKQEDSKEKADSEDSKDDDKSADDNQNEEKEENKDEEKADDEKKEEDKEEPDEKITDDSKSETAKDDDSENGKELSDAEKEQLKDSYKKAFKAALEKCKFETSFSELNLEQKIKFFETLYKAWGNKADPSEFMDDKETEQLEKIIVKKS